MGDVKADRSVSRPPPRRGLAALAMKVMISVAIGLGAFALSQALYHDTETQLLLGIGAAVLVCGIAFMVQFLLDVESRIGYLQDSMREATQRDEHHRREVARMTDEQLEKINDATELFGAVEASALRTDRVTQLVRDAATVARRSDSLVSRFAQYEFSRLSGYLRALGQHAAVPYEGEDRDWLLGLTRVASSTIDATSLTIADPGGGPFTDGGRWTGDLGQKYLVAQQAAVRRGVTIRRIFILDRPEFVDDKTLVHVLRQYLAAGVQVRTLAPGADRYPFTDFIVFDGELCYLTQPASRLGDSRPIVASTTLITAPDSVQERIAQYEELWEAATVYTAAPAIPNQPPGG